MHQIFRASCLHAHCMYLTSAQLVDSKQTILYWHSVAARGSRPPFLSFLQVSRRKQTAVLVVLNHNVRLERQRTKSEICRCATAYNWGPVAVNIEESGSLPPNHSPRSEGRQPPSVPISPKKHRSSLGSRKLSGRPASKTSATSSPSAAVYATDPDVASTCPSSHPGHRQHADQILSKVRDWLHQEKARATKGRLRRHGGHARHGDATGLVKSMVDYVHGSAAEHQHGQHRRHSSDLSEEALALEKLEQILGNELQLDDDNETIASARKPSIGTRKGSSRRSLRKQSSVIASDTDQQDGDIRVPSAEVVLDNSKTLSYTGGAASSQSDLTTSGKRAKKEAEAWIQFKNEIVRLAHTLRLKGWRRVPLDRGAEIDVERLSGALTNAVYVVSPPKDLSFLLPNAQDSTTSLTSKRPPALVAVHTYNQRVH